MKCIFCECEKPPSDEHIFPSALGGKFVTNLVCEECNNNLGTKVDTALTDHVLIRFKRATLANALGKRAPGIEEVLGTGTLSANPELRVKTKRHAKNGKLFPFIIPSEIKLNIDKEHKSTQYTFDARDKSIDIAKIIQRQRSRDNLPPLNGEEIENAIKTLSIDEIKADSAEVTYQVNIDYVEFHRPIVKIAFELAHEWLGEAYANDPHSIILRQYILGGEIEVRGQIDIGIPEDSPLNMFKYYDDGHLIGSLIEFEGKIFALIRIFNCMSGIILISKTPEKYNISKNFFAYIYDVRSRKTTHPSWEEVISTFISRFSKT